MTDLEKLNENVETSTSQENEVNEPTIKVGEKTIVDGTVLSVDDKGDAVINFGFKSDGIIPITKFEKEPKAGDKVTITLENRNGSIVIGEIISHTSASEEASVDNSVAQEAVASPAECEHPTDDAPEENDVPKVFDIYGKVVNMVGYETGKGNYVTLEMLETKEKVTIPTSVIKFDVELGWTLKLEVKQVGENRTITAAQIFSRGEEPSKQGATQNQEDNSNTNVEDNVSDSKPEKDEEEKDEIDLHYINRDLMMECMSIPTHSKLEFRMVSFIVRWARINKVKFEFDTYGNVYLTKGELEDGEYYPCVTSHMDTVQYKHDPYIYAGVPLALKIEKVKKGEHKLLVNNEDGTLGTEIGIGADDKAGILICLSLFEHFEKLKACFFLEEETGCDGSDHMDVGWFNNVGYVIGFDSPELYRAAWSCSNTKLFNYDFYEKWMKPVCDEWGLKNCFYSEPYTDVKNIREKTNIICMNFGNGGYNAHNIGGTEYLIMEDTDQACGMAIDLIDHIGLSRHILKHTRKPTTATANVPSYVRDEEGVWNWNCYDIEDDKKLEALGDDTRINVWSSNRSSSSNSSNNTNTNTNTNNNSSTNAPIIKMKEVSKEDEIKFETVKYIVNRYESHIDSIKKELVEEVKKLCESNNVDSSEFEKVLSNAFNNEIKF